MRMRILNRLGARFELSVGEPLLKSAMQRQVQGQAGANNNSVADISGFRDFISGSALVDCADGAGLDQQRAFRRVYARGICCAHEVRRFVHHW